MSTLAVKIEPTWKAVLEAEFSQPYFEALAAKVREDYLTKTTYPAPEDIFNAFTLCPFDQVRVVILGQDPYHGPGQAHGLAFSVPEGIKIPPSLQNIYKEIQADVGNSPATNGNLEHWAKQGVLLLNATLTVLAGLAGSHQKIGWENFTDTIIKTISEKHEHVVFMLWGNFARSKAGLIDQQKHLVLEAAHPSPLSAHNGFFGCRHFSQTNRYLTEHGKTAIKW